MPMVAAEVLDPVPLTGQREGFGKVPASAMASQFRCAATVMAAQLRHLANLSSYPNVSSG